MITQNEYYAEIGTKLIEQEFPDILEYGVTIAWLESDQEKKKATKTVFADCRPVNKQYSWCCPYDFMITVYAPNVAAFSPEQIEILLRHELMHVGINQNGPEPKFYVVPHDIEEFYSIINRFGIDWQQ